jgi:hypothetical protein
MDVNFEILIIDQMVVVCYLCLLRWLIDTCMLAGFELVSFVCL